ncbi:PH domain-containing protein [Aliifodinibius sp. S!AR15-10]|uniref:PH domain-containing protein n=1 Tax=Aliifodinibius sp. S!AR15-10 TaxID=2950437 RepID=UPI00286195F6|nr:PH domain-containing protein [Aliifodinibius sp. S!AR15-10]MDR8390825.1 PH domain-containing protein [Aliifodinibius sp. S!AR15-10]
MAEESAEKKITLSPSWKQYFIRYLLSVLAVPLFGIGLVALYFVRRKQTSSHYIITDTQISSVDSRYHRNLDLVNIEEVTVQQSWINKKLGVGTIVLKTSAVSMELIGMERPHQLKETIQKAVAIQKKQQEKKRVRKTPDPKYKPGSMEKMDYLTGLWQQGLLSDEDFKNEKKNFE